MNGATHLIAGLAISVYSGYTSPANLVVVGISSLLPDIDVKSSLLGRFIPFLPSVLERTVGHRTITHSLITTIGLSGVLYMFSPNLLIPFLIGFLSHLILDIFTGGVPLLYPFNKRFAISFGLPSAFTESITLIGFGIYLGLTTNWLSMWETIKQSILLF